MLSDEDQVPAESIPDWEFRFGCWSSPPFSGKSLTPADWGLHLDAQLAELRAAGSTVETIFPGAELDHLFGANAMDSHAATASSPRGVRTHGRRFATEHGRFWM
ncbi:hypothetical protein [Pseudoclavibacter sp. RFBA6]|uniref:hypothetical protein n=1 Tax=Pseudoclavibacter sp. RFBA6 TaxID=2080573 RepID=UPI0011B0B15B|nr:hypothetical protein [Pseudoclavibacter sp. RFBA6]